MAYSACAPPAERNFLVELWSGHCRWVVFAVALSGNAHDGWDLLQDALIRLARAWNRVEADGDVHAYTRTILVRMNLN